ncbi:MAG: carbohydrate ABC transporter permease [Caldilinea sp.]|uniref:carbohydrate ABC transporter permease n=1 Tax=Caldilinea sp. TaxID=2293560 RepID=UPI002C85ABAF|nr:carbohydrate ABC transporter permease [Caldilinea sp.]HRA65522.1 carbohydrate ABC transporter permease [Caldilinea sp.]
MTGTTSSTTIHSTSSRMRRRAGLFALYVVCVLLAILFLFPVFWSTLTSVKPPAEASAVPPTYWPSTFTFDNYLKLNKYGAGILRYVYNSASVALITVFGTILLSTLAGYGFSRFHFPAKNVLFIMVLAALMIPFQSILTPLFLLMSAVKMQNTLFGLALVYITFQLPFGVFMMRNSFDAVPREIEEAALLDGCSTWKMLTTVMFVLVRPGIITVAVYAFLNAWNEFLAALIIMTQEVNFTLPIMLTSVRSGYYGAIDWGALQAGITVTILPCIILFLFLQRYYLQGLMGGAVKG